MDQLRQDLRYAIRIFLRNPTFTCTVVLTLALGIGATTSVFSLVNSILLKPLPVPNPEELVFISRTGNPGWAGRFPYRTFKFFRDQNQAFSGMFAFASPGSLSVKIEGQDDLIISSGELVSGTYHSTLGVSALLGRTLVLEDDEPPGGPPVVVISYNFWKRGLGLDPAAVGKSILINNAPFQIVGVMPPSFYGMALGLPRDITIPITKITDIQSANTIENMDRLTVEIMARRKSDITPDQTRAHLNLLWGQLDDPSRGNSDEKIEVLSGANGISMWRNRFSTLLYILMGIVGLVLLVACANIANLMFVRAATRQHEIGVRLALGARPLRIIQQLIVETLVLACLGGLLGFLLAIVATRVLLVVVINNPNILALETILDTHVLAFTGLVSLLSATLFGVLPALRYRRMPVAASLRAGAPSWSGGTVGLQATKFLVAAQFAVSLLLLIGAGLLIRTMQNLKSVEVGFNSENVLLIRIDSTAARYRPEQLTGFYTQLLERIQALPGVQSASVSGSGLFTGFGFQSRISVPGNSNESVAFQNAVGPAYFKTIGMELLRGRDLSTQDNENAPKVAVINESMSRLYFPGEDPIGRDFTCDARTVVQVVGVVKDAKFNSLRESTTPVFYVPYLQSMPMGRDVIVKMAGDLGATGSLIRKEVEAINHNVFVLAIQKVKDGIDRTMSEERLFTYLTSFFGLVTLLLSSVGLYGVIAHLVVRRYKEIGIRVSLGAQSGDVLWLLFRETFFMLAVGMGIGCIAALATTRLISHLLFGVTAGDPLTIGLAILVLSLVAMLATYLPARKALSVDPMAALRSE